MLSVFLVPKYYHKKFGFGILTKLKVVFCVWPYVKLFIFGLTDDGMSNIEKYTKITLIIIVPVGAYRFINYEYLEKLTLGNLLGYKKYKYVAKRGYCLKNWRH